MDGFDYQFEWDPQKEAANFRKHGISFRSAASAVLDPLAQTMLDPVHTVEDRWIGVGRSRDGRLILVVYTWEDLGASAARVRIISARVATRPEAKSYEEGL